MRVKGRSLVRGSAMAGYGGSDRGGGREGGPEGPVAAKVAPVGFPVGGELHVGSERNRSQGFIP